MFQTIIAQRKPFLYIFVNIFFSIFKNAPLFLPIRHCKLCGSRRCGCTLVGYKIQKSVVDLVPDGTDQRRFTAKCCAGDLLGVEYPQVLPAAAATGHNDLIYPPALIQRADGCGDLPGSFKALHRYRAQQQPDGRPAAADHIADVLQRRSGFAGDDTNTFWVCWQRLFMCRVEQAFLFQPGFQLLQRKLCRAQTVREHLVHIDLKRTVPLVKGSTAAHYDPHSLLRAKCQPTGIGAEHDCLYAGCFIPQRKVTVPAAGVLHKVCNLAPQGKIKQAVVHIQQRFDIVVQLRYRDHISHRPASRAARMDTPMALSLEYCPGTK